MNVYQPDPQPSSSIHVDGQQVLDEKEARIDSDETEFAYAFELKDSSASSATTMTSPKLTPSQSSVPSSSSFGESTKPNTFNNAVLSNGDTFADKGAVAHPYVVFQDNGCSVAGV